MVACLTFQQGKGTGGESRLVACLTSQLYSSVSQRRFCSGKLTCCNSELQIKPSIYLAQSQYTDTGPTSPRHGPCTARRPVKAAA